MSARNFDKKGRSTSTRFSPAEREADAPDGQYLPLERQIIESFAWRAMSVNGLRVLSRVILEHLEHGGYRNGYLPVTFSDFESYGVHRESIKNAIIEAVSLGFLEVVTKGKMRSGDHPGTPTLFRLTFKPVFSDGGIVARRDLWKRFISIREAKAVVKAAIADATGDEASTKGSGSPIRSGRQHE